MLIRMIRRCPSQLPDWCFIRKRSWALNISASRLFYLQTALSIEHLSLQIVVAAKMTTLRRFEAAPYKRSLRTPQLTSSQRPFRVARPESIATAKKLLTLLDLSCYTCGEAMLICSVSFKFNGWSPKGINQRRSVSNVSQVSEEMREQCKFLWW